MERSFSIRLTSRRLVALTLALVVSSWAVAHERRVNTWLVCGAFESSCRAEFERDLIDEANVRPTPGVASCGKPWRYCDDRLYCRNLDDYVDLYTFFGKVRSGSPGEPTTMRAAYAHTYVWSPERQAIKLLIGSSDGYRLWVNGKLRHTAFHMTRLPFRDQDTVDARLEAGWNRLLLKIHNGLGIWGFYVKLAGQDGAPLEDIEYSIESPAGPLRIVTTELPKGYCRWPYVWLEIGGVVPEPRVPSASPYRLMAKGGTPPYRWTIPPANHLPPGIYLDGDQGEILGVCGNVAGEYAFTIQVSDAEGNATANTLSIAVKERPDRWFEEARIGGLIHGGAGYDPPHGEPELQAELMVREGYAWAAQTTAWHLVKETWDYYAGAEKDPGNAVAGRVPEQLSGHQDVSEYVKAFREHGIRFGSYVGLPDPWPTVFDPETKDYGNWPLFIHALHSHLEAMAVDYEPALLWLDGARGLYGGSQYWCFDALYSVVKTIAPECLLIPNSRDDYNVGDADIISWEGNNDTEAYWSRWPTGQSGLNPKPMPVETWRYPFPWKDWEGTVRMEYRKPGEPDYMDWEEWARVIVSLVAEGYVCDLDHSFSNGREQMHQKLGDWLFPRLDAIVGTYPGPLDDADWGYDVVRNDTIYLHIMKNARGKVGIEGKETITVGPVTGRIKRVALFPDGTTLAYESADGRVTISLAGVTPDPVSTIIAIEVLGTTESGGPLRTSDY